MEKLQYSSLELRGKSRHERQTATVTGRGGNAETSTVIVGRRNEAGQGSHWSMPSNRYARIFRTNHQLHN
jgi:hypothetical protein